MNSKLTKEQIVAFQEKLRWELPHLYGWKWYRWARAYFESTNRVNLLCAANQISKSTTAIRKNIDWATDKSKWPKLWSSVPRQFWYLYPSSAVATDEFQLKWAPEVLPKCGDLYTSRRKERLIHPVYGWEANYDGKDISSISFTSGLELQFRFYTQNVHNLQTGTVHMVTCDEELPEEYYSELMARLYGTDGYFNMVYTATRNQLMWYLAMQGTKETETFTDAFKLQITMDDCQVYEDGSPGHFNKDKIKDIIKNCRNDNEVQRRVYGRHVREGGLKYGAFDPERHFIKPFPIPDDYKIYGGVDIGGGGNSHPTAMGFIAVKPDNSCGYVFRGGRFDNDTTTAGDAFLKFVAMRAKLIMTLQTADPGSKDFYTIAERSGEAFTKPERNHEIGEHILNTLFENDMMFIFDLPELRPLGTELMTLKASTNKKVAKDDFIDGALRYPGVMVPWDWSKISEKEKEKHVRKTIGKSEDEIARELLADQIRERRGEHRKKPKTGWDEMDQAIQEWNESYG
jgi:phage terminase large subunit-like protein